MSRIKLNNLDGGVGVDIARKMSKIRGEGGFMITTILAILVGMTIGFVLATLCPLDRHAILVWFWLDRVGKRIERLGHKRGRK
jgi:hypothetical protein